MDRGLKALASKGLYGHGEHGLRGKRGRGEEKKEKRGPGRSPGAIFFEMRFYLVSGPRRRLSLVFLDSSHRDLRAGEVSARSGSASSRSQNSL